MNEQKDISNYFSISYLEFLDCLNRLAITLHQKPAKPLYDPLADQNPEATNDGEEAPPQNNDQEDLKWEEKK